LPNFTFFHSFWLAQVLFTEKTNETEETTNGQAEMVQLLPIYNIEQQEQQ
jgi:hypothetical protein